MDVEGGLISKKLRISCGASLHEDENCASGCCVIHKGLLPTTVSQRKIIYGLFVAVFSISSFFAYNDFIFASKSSSYFEAR